MDRRDVTLSSSEKTQLHTIHYYTTEKENRRRLQLQLPSFLPRFLISSPFNNNNVDSVQITYYTAICDAIFPFFPLYFFSLKFSTKNIHFLSYSGPYLMDEKYCGNVFDSCSLSLYASISTAFQEKADN
jgi:hypothetical protein